MDVDFGPSENAKKKFGNFSKRSRTNFYSLEPCIVDN